MEEPADTTEATDATDAQDEDKPEAEGTEPSDKGKPGSKATLDAQDKDKPEAEISILDYGDLTSIDGAAKKKIEDKIKGNTELVEEILMNPDQQNPEEEK